MSLKSLYEQGKHMMIEEDEENKKPNLPSPSTKSSPTPTHAPIYQEEQMSTPASIPTQYNSPFQVPSTPVMDEGVYKKLLDKTNFDTTSVGQTIHKYFDALDDSGLDTNTKFRTAMKQASKLDGVTQDKVLEAFDTIKSALQKEVDRFAGIASSIEDAEIKARQQKIKDIDAQVEQLAEQQTQLKKELADAINSHSTGTQQFNMASQRRATEIDQQKAQFASLLSH